MPVRMASITTLITLGLLLGLASGAAGDQPAAKADDDAAVFFESFDAGWEQRWAYSKYKKFTGRFQHIRRRYSRGRGDMAIMIPEPNRHYAMAAALPRPLPGAGGLTLQYEAQITDTHACGGAYVKLLSAPGASGEGGGGGKEGDNDGDKGGKISSGGKGKKPFAPEAVSRRAPYSVMFGPDRCGAAARVHVILKLFNPARGNATEHHLAAPPSPPNDRLPHVYTLELSAANNSYRVLIDGEEKAAGGLDDDGAFEPPLRPPSEVADPDDAQPADWDEREEIDDPDAKKPADWDNRRTLPDMDAAPPAGWLEHEPTHVFDEAAVRPDDWDDAADGAWAPPQIANPKCKDAPGCGPWPRPHKRNPNYRGVWLPPRVKNPAYRGEWKPRRIRNPLYFEEAEEEGRRKSPLLRMPAAAGVAFELWTTDAGYAFDGVLAGPAAPSARRAAEAYRADVWRRRYWEEFVAAETRHRREQIAAVAAPARWLMMAFEFPPLSPLRARAVPALELLYASPAWAWAVVAPALLLAAAALAVAVRSSGGGGKEDEEEVDGDADAPEEEEEEREEKEAAAAAADGSGSDEAAAGGRPDGSGGNGGLRRRARRA